MGTMKSEVQKAGLTRAIPGETDEAEIQKPWLVFNERKTVVSSRKRSAGKLFAESFGMWAERDIDIKQTGRASHPQ